MVKFSEYLWQTASSPLALVGYIVILAAWVLKNYLLKKPKQQLQNILTNYKDEDAKNKALKILLGNDPPKRLKSFEVIEWAKIKMKEKEKNLLLIAYLSTLVVFLAIVSFSVYKSVNEKEISKPPILLDEKVERKY